MIYFKVFCIINLKLLIIARNYSIWFFVKIDWRGLIYRIYRFLNGYYNNIIMSKFIIEAFYHFIVWNHGKRVYESSSYSPSFLKLVQIHSKSLIIENESSRSLSLDYFSNSFFAPIVGFGIILPGWFRG